MGVKERIVLLGGGGHAKVLIELIVMSGKYEIAGILDPQAEPGASVHGIAVLGDDSLLADLKEQGMMNACIAVGSVRDNTARRILYEQVRRSGLYVPSLIHPRAVISEAGTGISEGVQIMAGAIIQAGSTVGENTIVNTGAIVEHDCTVGRNVHICPGAVICGGSVIGDNTFIGAGATLIQGIEIGPDSIVGAGTVVVRNVADGELVRGAR